MNDILHLGKGKQKSAEKSGESMDAPVDKWEHRRIVGIPNSEIGIRDFIGQHKRAGTLHPICEGALKIFLEHRRKNSKD